MFIVSYLPYRGGFDAEDLRTVVVRSFYPSRSVKGFFLALFIAFCVDVKLHCYPVPFHASTGIKIRTSVCGLTARAFPLPQGRSGRAINALVLMWGWLPIRK
jgi:hypothetical protein